MKKIAIIGFDDLGQAFAKVFSRNLPNAEIWAHTFTEKIILTIAKKTINPNFDEVYDVPNLNISFNVTETVHCADLIVIACKLKNAPLYMDKILESINHETQILVLRKGHYPGTSESLRAYLEKRTQDNPLVTNITTLAGSFKNKLLYYDEPQITTLIGKDNQYTLDLKKALSNDRLKVYVSTDILGTEVWTSFADVLQMFAGILYELKFDKHVSLGVVTRYIREIQNLLIILGAKESTFTSLAVLPTIWEYTFDQTQQGFVLGRDIIKLGKRALNSKKTKNSIEGLWYLRNLMNENKIVMPFTDTLYKLLYKDLSPKQAEALFFKMNIVFEDNIFYTKKEDN